MKKLLSVVLVFIMMMTSGCVSSYEYVGSGPNIVSTIFASYDFAKAISDDGGNFTMLLKPGTEAHSYEPTPKDIVTISECDIFIYVGGENDAWVNEILESVDNPDMVVIRMLDLVEKYEEEHIEGMECEDEECEQSHDEDKADWDEHVWITPKNAKIICQAIRDAFCRINPAAEEFYKENYEQYAKQLDELDEKFRNVVENANRDTIIFGDRFPLRYFVEEYDLNYYAAFSGCSSDTEASAATIAFLIDKVKEEEIPVIFKIELSNEDIAKTIAEETGADIRTFNTCHNVTANEFKNGATYLLLMEKNLKALEEALK